jgi:hypothetical protein
MSVSFYDLCGMLDDPARQQQGLAAMDDIATTAREFSPIEKQALTMCGFTAPLARPCRARRPQGHGAR